MMDQELTVGQDAFLDVVANLVGILIILVVVVGAQAGSVWQSKTPVEGLENRLRELDQETIDTAETAENLQIENHELEQKILAERSVTAELERQRSQLLIQLEMVRRQTDFDRQNLEAQRQRQLDTAAKIDRLMYQLEQTKNNIAAVNHLLQPTRKTIEHYPTPIAKTVFSDEVHFRILGGKIVYVPLEELVSRMKSEWKVKAEKLKTVPNTVETVGPVGDFRLQYELEVTQLEGREGLQTGVQFKRFSLQPVGDDIGETLESALSASSRFRKVLDRLVPEKTTVSIWVYPESYREFAEVKDWLRQKGFQTASWPLAEGRSISGGPSGFRTAAN